MQQMTLALDWITTVRLEQVRLTHQAHFHLRSERPDPTTSGPDRADTTTPSFYKDPAAAPVVSYAFKPTLMRLLAPTKPDGSQVISTDQVIPLVTRRRGRIGDSDRPDEGRWMDLSDEERDTGGPTSSEGVT